MTEKEKKDFYDEKRAELEQVRSLWKIWKEDSKGDEDKSWGLFLENYLQIQIYIKRKGMKEYKITYASEVGLVIETRTKKLVSGTFASSNDLNEIEGKTSIYSLM